VLLAKPGPNVQPPVPIQVEYASGVTNLEGLKKELEDALHDKLIFGPNVELVPEGTLPRYEMKAKLIRKFYEEK
jgi:phenylacetate-CoA ligase